MKLLLMLKRLEGLRDGRILSQTHRKDIGPCCSSYGPHEKKSTFRVGRDLPALVRGDKTSASEFTSVGQSQSITAVRVRD